MKLQLERDLAAIFRDYDSARVIAQQYKTEMLPRAEQAHSKRRIMGRVLGVRLLLSTGVCRLAIAKTQAAKTQTAVVC